MHDLNDRSYADRASNDAGDGVAGATGTPPSKWEKLIGEIEMLSLAFHPRCNLRVTVSGAGEEREVFDAAIELLQREHPYVASEKGPGR